MPKSKLTSESVLQRGLPETPGATYYWRNESCYSARREIWTQFAKIQEAVILAGADIQESQAQFNSEAQSILDRALETDDPISSNPFPELAGGYL